MNKYGVKEKINLRRRKKGVTLVALVITVIVTLILASITIAAISGNSVITSSKKAKEQAEINSEIKVIGTAVNQAKDSDRYGDLEETTFKTTLDANAGNEKTELKYYKDQNMFSIRFKESGRTYQVYTNGYAKYVGVLNNAIMISADPSSNISLNEEYKVNITILSFVQNNINNIKYEWTKSDEQPSEYTKIKEVSNPTDDNSGKTKKTSTPIELSKDVVGDGKYYLHVQVTKENGEIETETFGPYAIGVAEVKLAVNPNGGTWAQTENGIKRKDIQYIDAKPNETVEILDATPQKYIVKFDTGTQIEANVNFDKWNLKDKGSITLSQNNKSIYTFGNGQGTITAQYLVEKITLPNATKEGHIVEGWYKGNIKVGVPGTEYTPTYNQNGEETLTVKWVKQNFTATFNGNGGTNGASILKPFEEPLGTLPTSTRNGYTFKG